jgi:lipopolysaccharide heptosyltransferase II
MSAQTPLIELNPKKILIRSTNWIGDAVMTTPAVHTIRENFPDAEITMLAVPWVADIFDLSPDVDKLIIYDKKFLYQGKIKGPLNLAKDLKPFGFDAAILLQNAFEAAFLAKMAGIPVRAGYKRDGRGVLLTHGVDISDAIRKKHQVHYYQNMLAGLGLTLGPDHLRLPLSEKLESWAQEFIDGLKKENPTSLPDQEDGNEASDRPVLKPLNKNGGAIPVIGFNPGAAFGPAKRWSTEKFGQLAAIIVHHYGENGCVIMVFGTEADTAAAHDIKQFSIRTPAHVVDMTGKTSLQQAMALIKNCDAFISNDSGLMHVAAALATPTIAIFGSTNHITTGPYSENSIILRREMDCSPCLKANCPQGHLKCLESIKSTDVYEELVQMLSSKFLPDS